MDPTEEVLHFECGGDPLYGVFHRPAGPFDTVVVIVVGGPQYRVGSHRQFVHLARALAQAGVAALRFDHRGMGDSHGQPRSFEALTGDIEAAVAAAQTSAPDARRIVLWGLCDGATAAVLAAGEGLGPRLAGLCLANPWVRSDVSEARTRLKHYYVQRLRDPAFWKKLLGGRVALSAIGSLWQSVRSAASRAPAQAPAQDQRPYQQRMASSWSAFPGKILLLLSTDDYTAREFDDHAATDASWRGLLARDNVSRLDVTCDHTFSDPAAKAAVADATVRWVMALPHPPIALHRHTSSGRAAP